MGVGVLEDFSEPGSSFAFPFDFNYLPMWLSMCLRVFVPLGSQNLGIPTRRILTFSV